ncbi:MAG: hypothetical protein FD130_248 [Halothiobacillaceae bacterium]|nr:MAG: hypothetical protein FD130_248 [Halothiobacillaceae bacterium]
MATVNFSVPDEVKQLFNASFEGKNKSAVIAELMLQAVKNQKEQEKRAAAIERLLARRKNKKPVTTKEIAVAREALRS